jgi:hypothetical protein
MTVGAYVLWYIPGHFRYGWITVINDSRITIRCVDHREPTGWLVVTVDARDLRVMSAPQEVMG